jgi:4-amino-4-deoxychorismate lyase
MKLFDFEYTICNIPFSLFSLTFLNKYPNKYAPHVLNVDVICRYVTSQGNLYSRRIITTHDHRLGMCFIEEISIINPSTQSILVLSENKSHSSLFNVHETCQYTASDTRIHVKQNVKLSSIFPSWIEEFMLNIYKTKAEKSRLIYNTCQE